MDLEDEDAPLVSYIHLIGNLGNQLFQIAAAYAHALRIGGTLRLSNNADFGDDTFLHKCRVCVGSPPNTPCVPEPHFHYVPIPEKAQWLHGYYQSSRYFADVKDAVLDLFDPALRIKTLVAERYGEYLGMTGDYEDTVVVHVRRGDYVTPSNMPVHGILTPTYFRAAMALFKEAKGPACKFLFFSDDIEYCRSVFGRDPGVICVDEPNATLALHLMSRFKHYIMSNSSFSWWATYLGNPATTVIAPRSWVGPQGPQDFEDIYEPDWILLPAE